MIKCSFKSVAVALSVTLCLCLDTFAEETDTSTASGLIDASYSAMVQADLHRDGKDMEKALAGYRKALSGFITVSQNYPELDPEVVRFRMAYCDNQIEVLMKDMGINGDTHADSPESREVRSPSIVQTTSATAHGLEMQLRSIRKMISDRDLPEARAALLTLLKQQPDDPELRILMAIVQSMLGRFDDADNILTALIEEKPEMARAYAVLSTAKLGLGQMDNARKALQEAVRLGSTSPEVYYNMTQIILATKPLDTDAARDNYRKSLELGGREDPDLDYLLK